MTPINPQWRPSVRTTVAAGTTDTTSFVFSSPDGGPWAISSIHIQTPGTTYSNVKVSARSSLNGAYWFQDVHAAAITNLFWSRDLAVPIVVPPGESLHFEVTPLILGQDVTITVCGYTGDALELFNRQLRIQHGDQLPETVLAYVPHVDVPATVPFTTVKRIVDDHGMERLNLVRLAMWALHEGDYMQVIGRVGGWEFMPRHLAIGTTHVFYRYRQGSVPLEFGGDKQMLLEITNEDNVFSFDRDFSLIAECHVIRGELR